MTESSAAKADATFLPRADDYCCDLKIATGYDGATDVYLAHHVSSSLPLIVRRTNLEILSPENLEELQNELLVSGLLRHECIMPYYVNFVVSHQLWVVLPFMEFGSCSDVINAGFKDGLPELLIAAILRDVVSALDYLHGLGYIHRSVTARHIMIDRYGGVRLAGLRNVYATIKDGTRERAAHHFPAHAVTYPWLAGEIFQQNLAGYNQKSDIYSLGITALEMAYGRVPYGDLTATQVMLLKLTADPPPLSDDYTPDDHPPFSTPFKQFVDACLRTDPSERPTAAKLLSHPFFRQVRRQQSSRESPQSMIVDLLYPVLPMDPSKVAHKQGSPGTKENDLADKMKSMTMETKWAF
ncbi:STE20-related kinase adapter protein alpha-like [Oscarella lobularis]|uniref:STE20-related kinase adapter protein alpha-like n=1 Tax=Oscarella lobularis TaxID=121494 RepID=UPI003313A9C4